MNARSPLRVLGSVFAAAALLVGAIAAPVAAQPAPTTPTTVNIIGGAAGETRLLPAGQAEFGIRIPLRPNAENIVTITASDDQGRNVSKNVSITQLTLGEIVRAQVTAQRLTTAEVKQLVADGVIDIKDPSNFNVSRFVIVLTIGGRPAQVSVPVVTPKEEPLGFGPPISIGCAAPGKGLSTTERSISIPCGGGGGGGPTPTIQIIPFEMDIPDTPVEARVPGVIVIEGRIKTLKEFFRVNLILMNVSSLFNLQSITARLEVPEGALSHVAPKSGTVSIADIAPGGENKGEFIVRGDRIGTHTVTAHFGAELTSPFLPDPVPIAGSASTDLEVKGPPQMAVTVEHPNFVQKGEVYDLTVHIRNTDEELDALFTTFELDVGVDAQLIDETTGLPMEGHAIHELGDILRGQTVTRTFKVLPKKTGPIASCTAAATENLKLSMVFTGAGGPGGGPTCAIGTFPSEMTSPDGRPTVSVVPTHNTTGVTVEPAVVALFSAAMITQTITSGFDGASFRLIDPAGAVVPGELTFGEVFEGTVAVFRPTLPLAYSSEYTIVVEEAIFNEDGLALASGMTARFKTEPQPTAPDFDPPSGILLVEPPVNPDAITKGQLVPVIVDSFDNVGVTRVDALLDGNVIDSKVPQSPVKFLVDTAGLAQGTEHVLTARLLDEAGNTATLTATLRIAPDNLPPAVAVTAAASIARGRALNAVVEAADDGRVDRVQLFVDAGADPSQTLLVGPFAFSVGTTSLAAGRHVLRAVATDGAGNTAFIDHPFEVIDDSVPPTVVITSPAAGLEIRPGTILPVLVAAHDNIGVAAVEVFLDNELTPRSTDIAGFNLATAELALGPHRIRARVRDLAGNQTTVESPFVLFTPPPDATAPAAPLGAKIQVALPSNGVAAITAATGAVEAGARVEIQNTESLAGALATASGVGAFTSTIEGNGGQLVSFIAVDAAGNRSVPTLVEIPRPSTLAAIVVSPPTVTLNRNTTSQQLSVTGTYSDGSKRALSAGELTFSSQDPTTADVTASGLVLPGTNGATSVRVSSGAASPVDIPVVVARPTISSIHVTPSPVTLNDLGRTQRLSLLATYSDGFKQEYAGQVSFASNNPSIATIDSLGLITAVAVGDTVISVAPAGLAVVNVNVAVRRKTLTSIAVNPPLVNFIGTGQTQTLTVTGVYSDGSKETLTGGITLVSLNPAVASANGALVTSQGNGNTTIQVTAVGAPMVSVPVTVKSITSIALNPSNVTLIGTNKTRQLSVLRTFSDGSSAMDDTGVAFESSSPAVATVSTSGLVRSVDFGVATITARLGALPPTQSTVTVDRLKPEAIVASPASLSFSASGQTAQLTAQYRLNDGSLTAILDPITFTSRDLGVVHVSGAAVVTAIGTGLTFVDVTAGGLTVAVVAAVDIDVVGPPEITSLGRRVAGEGDTVLIHGRNFHGFADRNDVTFNGVAATVIGASDDRLVALVPRGATSGPVQVGVDGSLSNVVNIDIYPRRGQAQRITSAFSASPAAPGTRMTLGTVTVDYRDGDDVVLAGDPNTIAASQFSSLIGPQFTGRLVVTLGVQESQVQPSSSPVDLTALLTLAEGDNIIAFHLEAVAGNLSSDILAIVSGPANTGAFVGERFLPADTIDQQLVVRFRNLKNGTTLLPNGSKVGVTAANWNRISDGGCCNGSAGGAILGGDPTSDGRVRAFTITNGEIVVPYSDAGIFAGADQATTAIISVVPADSNGNRTQDRPIAAATVLLGGVDSASIIPAQTSSVADGTDRPIHVEVNSIRDDYGNAIPDGTRLGLTASNWNRVSDGGCCNGSVGGAFTDGYSTGDGRVRGYVVEQGKVMATYSPVGVSLQVGDIRGAILSAVVIDTATNRRADRPFAAGHVTLSSAAGGEVRTVALPGTLSATTQDNRSVITVFNITDSAGRPVPDGTKIGVTAANWNRVSDGGCCNGAIGGSIIGGNPTNDGRVRWFPVQGAQLVFEYSAAGIGLGKDVTGNAIVSILPADGNGNRVGDRPLAAVTIPLGGVSSATVTPDFASSIADGTDRPIRVVVDNIRDAFGNPVPNGTRIGLTAKNWNRLSDGGCCNGSVGGEFTDGDATPDGRVRGYTVTNGRVEATYSPVGVALGVGDVRAAFLSALLLRPDGGRVADRPFAAGQVTLSSASGASADIVVAPTTLLADTQQHLSTITITDLRDSQGRLVPNGTRFGVTAANWNRASDGGCCNGSIGGDFIGGSSTSDGRVKSFPLTNGKLQFTYSDAGIGLQTMQTAAAIISVLPADGNGNHIGNTPVLATTVMLAGVGSATYAAPATVLPGGSASIVFSDIRDQFGNPVPDGTRIGLTAANWNRVSDGGCCNSSAGGGFSDGEATPDGRVKMFTVTGGQVVATFVAPTSNNVTAVVSAMLVRVDGSVIGFRPFAAGSIRVTNTP